MTRLYFDSTLNCFINNPSLKPKKSKKEKRVSCEYLERRIPTKLFKKADKLIDTFLKENGFDPEGDW